MRATVTSIQSGILVSVLYFFCSTGLASPLTGLSGALKTPTADITPSGVFIHQYNSFTEPRFEENFNRHRNHTFTLGIYNRIELGGRLTDFPAVGEKFDSIGRKRGRRDLSGNIKINPFRFHDKLQFAFGAFDFAGEAQNFSSEFGVLSFDLGKSLFSVGFSSSDNVGGAGKFANAIYRFNDYLGLIAEYDTNDEFNAGVQIDVPLYRNTALRLTLASFGGDFGGGVAWNIPLGMAWSKPISQPTRRKNLDDVERSADAFHTKLIDIGFEQVRVGEKEGTVYAVVEDRIHRRSSMDTIAAVYAAAIAHLPAQGDLTLQINDRGLPLFSVAIDLEKLSDYLSNPVESSEAELRNSMRTVTGTTTTDDVDWLSSERSSNKTWLEITASPALRSAIGTEFRLIDASLAADLEARVPLWSGATAVASALAPLFTTDNFDDGGPFESRAHEAMIDQVAIQQRLTPMFGIHTLIEAGSTHVLGNPYTKLTGSAAWLSQNSGWGALAEAGFYEFQDADVSRQQVSGTVRYSFDKQDVVVDASYGQYFFGDTGVKLGLTRRFRDTFVQLFVNVIDSNDLTGGLRVSLPLTPTRSYQSRGIVVGGARRWSHSLTTTIKDPVVVGSNRLQVGFLLDPVVNDPLLSDTLDSGRLTKSYISSHLGLLREKIEFALAAR